MKPATNRLKVDRLLVEPARARDLLQHAAAQHGDAVAERHGLGLVVRDVDGRRAEAPLEARDLGAGLPAQLGVEVRQRLVEEERLRVAHDRATHRDALALAAGEVRGLAVQVLAQVEHVGGALDLPADLLLVVLALGEPERERDVLGHREVRVERVVLEHHREVALARRLLVDARAVDVELAGRDVLEPDDHAQDRRLPRAGRPDEDDELAVGDVEVHAVHREEPVAVALDDVLQGDRRHQLSPRVRRAARCPTARAGRGGAAAGCGAAGRTVVLIPSPPPGSGRRRSGAGTARRARRPGSSRRRPRRRSRPSAPRSTTHR
ncbi:MAG: hypothetical protein K0S43_3908 [Cellulosimicrobium sp.]|nr:hypothetical protein [Cellulosimicrobium sp.]